MTRISPRLERTKLDLTAILAERVDWRYKSFPDEPGICVRDVPLRRWRVLDGDFAMPIVLLKDSALRHNVDVLARFCDAHNLLLAPHGKTAMSPQLMQLQFDAGAWAVTAATVWQARMWRRFGAKRILLANQVVDARSAQWLAEDLRDDPLLELFCLVDSREAVELLDDALDAGGALRPLPVLVEVGYAGGRSGCRTTPEAVVVAQAIAKARHLQLAGVEGFEGVIDGRELTTTLAAVDDFVAQVRAVTAALDDCQAFDQCERIIVSAGGSAFPDRVVDGLTAPWNLTRDVQLVLRSGCYVTHDAVHYELLGPFGTRLPNTSALKPAFEAWGSVLSVPEPGLAIIGFGKRDVSYDLDLPLPSWRKRGRELPRALDGRAVIVELNDQHAYLRFETDLEIGVGELIGCGISHPCTVFDKWRLLPIVDDHYITLEALMTFF